MHTNICISQHIHEYTHICFQIYAYTDTYIHTHSYILTHTHTHTYIYIYIYTHMYAYAHIYAHTCTHTYMHTHIYMHAHTHIYIWEDTSYKCIYQPLCRTLCEKLSIFKRGLIDGNSELSLNGRHKFLRRGVGKIAGFIPFPSVLVL